MEALRGIDLDIPEGMCFGLLGPNGAGKTTTIEIMEGIQKPDNGSLLFRNQPIAWPNDRSYKQKIGIQFQQSALPEFITVKETLNLFSSFYENSRPHEEIIRLCSLEDIINRDNRKLSGGQRQRMLLGLAIIPYPEIIFLDEPTTGLDPQSRRNFWDLIENIKAENCTIILTTHYMDEAQILCDEVAIMDNGKIIARDTPEKLLTNHFDGALIHLPWDENFTRETAHAMKEQFGNNEDVRITEEELEIVTPYLDKTIKTLLSADIVINNLNIHKPNLEDLFIKLTGSSLRT